MIAGRYNSWADWLDVLASAIQKPDSSLSVLRESKSFLNAAQRREADRIAQGIEQGRSWQSVLDEASSTIPKGLQGPLSRSVANNQLAETATLLADRLRAQHQFIQECFIAAMYTMVVVAVAWVGVLVLVVNLVPALNVTFELMHEPETIWLKIANAVYSGRWIWGVVVPVLVVSALIFWLGRHFQSSLLLRDKAHSKPQIERQILVLKLAVSMLPTKPPVEAVQIANRIFLGDEARVTSHLAPELSGLSGHAATMNLKNMVYWHSHRLEQQHRWWISKLPTRLTLAVGLTMVLAYILLGLLPWIWVLQRSLKEVT